MTSSQKLHRQKHLQKLQKPNMKTKTKFAGRQSAASLPPPIPQALLDIIVRCLVPDRNQRFQAILLVLHFRRRFHLEFIHRRHIPSHVVALNVRQDLAFVLTLLRRLFFMSTSIVYPRSLSLR